MIKFKFKVGDKVRILSDAKAILHDGKTVVDVYKVESAVGCIGIICNEFMHAYSVEGLPDVCYEYKLVGKGRWGRWNYEEDQLELVNAKIVITPESLNEALMEFDKYVSEENADMVNHPAHYTSFPMELKDWNFGVMQTIQDPIYCAYFKTMSEYLHRAHLKNGLEDIKKLLFWGNELVKHAEDGKVEVK